jgi:hypothetical protein
MCLLGMRVPLRTRLLWLKRSFAKGGEVGVGCGMGKESINQSINQSIQSHCIVVRLTFSPSKAQPHHIRAAFPPLVRRLCPLPFLPFLPSFSSHPLLAPTSLHLRTPRLWTRRLRTACYSAIGRVRTRCLRIFGRLQLACVLCGNGARARCVQAVAHGHAEGDYEDEREDDEVVWVHAVFFLRGLG